MHFVLVFYCLIYIYLLDFVGDEHPFSKEKLSPVLAFYTVKNSDEGIKLADNLIHFGGMGHSAVIHSENKDIIHIFGIFSKYPIDPASKYIFSGTLNHCILTLLFATLYAEIFAEVEPDPSFDTINRGVEQMRNFKPDVIIALGGGSPMDAAKGMWLFYEYPDADPEGMKLKFMDIRKRTYKFPKLGKDCKMVAIPTTSGTGSEVTSFAVITDKEII